MCRGARRSVEPTVTNSSAIPGRKSFDMLVVPVLAFRCLGYSRGWWGLYGALGRVSGSKEIGRANRHQFLRPSWSSIIRYTSIGF